MVPTLPPGKDMASIPRLPQVYHSALIGRLDLPHPPVVLDHREAPDLVLGQLRLPEPPGRLHSRLHYLVRLHPLGLDLLVQLHDVNASLFFPVGSV